jgi:hypothetical protein
MREQGVAVGFGCRDILRADRASRPSLVFEDDRLFEDCLERGVERAGYGVADATGRKRIDDSNGTRRIGIWALMRPAKRALVDAAVPTRKLRLSMRFLLPDLPGADLVIGRERRYEP